jgi:GH24 family phage-related lysozyme (muramidase)
MTPGPDCIKLVQEFEGCAKRRPDGSFEAYPDPGSGRDPWTIGWGSTGADIKKGVVWSQKQCDDRFTSHLGEFAAKVSKILGSTPTSQNQFDAMVSFAYNVGVGNLSASTLLKKHKARDYKGAAAEFARWNKAAGKVMAGLTRRRAAEAALYAS